MFRPYYLPLRRKQRKERSTIHVDLNKRGLDAALLLLDSLRGLEIAVGPGDPYHSRLLSLLEAGSPILHIPPRPLLLPALSPSETRLKIAEALLSGGPEAAGETAVEAVKAYAASGQLAPNSPITLAGGWMRSRVSGKAFHVSAKAGSVPLVNTGALLASITFTVRKKR